MGAISTPLLFAVYTVLSVSGMVLVKHALPLLRVAMAQGADWLSAGLLTAAGAGMYVVGFLTWMIILARTPLIVAYPTAVGLTMAFSTVCAILFLGEHLTLSSSLGIALVFVGVFLLARG